MHDWTFDSLPVYPFARLRSLLDGIPPGAEPVSLAVGGPNHPFPDFITRVLQEHSSGYGRYPPVDGTPDLRRACRDWLVRRYHLPEDLIDPERHICPVNGTREGLFLAALTLAPGARAGETPPAVLIPNPFYQCYAAAALAIGAEPVYVDATRETGFLPDFAHLPPAILARTVVAYLCSPANPQGTCARLEDWQALLDLADAHDFCIIADECYGEIYDREAPAGILQAIAARPAKDRAGMMERILGFHSLSKRSSVPGLRAGFAVGGAAAMDRFKLLRSYAGSTMALPVCAAAAAAWNDDAHVAANRALYRQKIDLAESIFGTRLGFYRPPGGFFLWLDVSTIGLDGEQAAREVWRQGGVRTLPGAYLSRSGAQGNPGASYLRLALVHDLDVTEKALTRVNQILR